MNREDKKYLEDFGIEIRTVHQAITHSGVVLFVADTPEEACALAANWLREFRRNVSLMKEGRRKDGSLIPPEPFNQGN